MRNFKSNFEKNLITFSKLSRQRLRSLECIFDNLGRNFRTVVNICDPAQRNEPNNTKIKRPWIRLFEGWNNFLYKVFLWDLNSRYYVFFFVRSHTSKNF